MDIQPIVRTTYASPIKSNSYAGSMGQNSLHNIRYATNTANRLQTRHLLHPPRLASTPLPPTPLAVCAGARRNIFRFFMGGVLMSTVKIEGMDKAILGVAVGDDYDNRMVYSIEKIVDELMLQNGWTADDAWEWFDFNIARSCVGSAAPILVYQDYELLLED